MKPISMPHIVRLFAIFFWISLCTSCSTKETKTNHMDTSRNQSKMDISTPLGFTKVETVVDSTVLLDGKWIGEMHDASGYHCSVDLTMITQNGQIVGEMNVVLYDGADGSIAGKAIVKGHIIGDSVELQLSDADDSTRVTTVVGRLNILKRPKFDRYCIYGVYTPSSAVLDLLGGVWIITRIPS